MFHMIKLKVHLFKQWWYFKMIMCEKGHSFSKLKIYVWKSFANLQTLYYLGMLPEIMNLFFLPEEQLWILFRECLPHVKIDSVAIHIFMCQHQVMWSHNYQNLNSLPCIQILSMVQDGVSVGYYFEHLLLKPFLRHICFFYTV